VTKCPACGRRVFGGASCLICDLLGIPETEPAAGYTGITWPDPVRQRFCRSCRRFVDVEFTDRPFHGVLCVRGVGHLVARFA
jgi:hypothetical protein